MLRRHWPIAAVTLVVAALVVWALARRDGDEGAPGAPLGGAPPKADAGRDCRTHVEGRLPPVDPARDLIVGPVRFRGFRAASRLALRENGRGFFEIRGGEYHGLKAIAEVRAGADVIVAIAPQSADSAGLLYDGDTNYGRFGIPFHEGERSVRFRACSADHRALSPRSYGRRSVGPWTQFSGGFILTEPQCLRLHVYARGGDARRFAEPFGRPRRGCGV